MLTGLTDVAGLLAALLAVQVTQLGIAIWQLVHLRAPKPPAGRVK